MTSAFRAVLSDGSRVCVDGKPIVLGPCLEQTGLDLNWLNLMRLISLYSILLR